MAYNLINFHKGTIGFLEREKYIPVPSFHTDILNLYENNDRLQAILAPVGFAKSSTLRSFALKNLLDDTKFQLYVSSSQSKITQHFSSFTKFLSSSDFQKVFNFKIVKCNTEQVIININNENRAIFGISAGSDISGINFESQRPQIINIDDLEELDQANSIERTNKLLDWLETTLLSRLPSLVDGKVRMIGTNLSLNSIINRMLTKQVNGWNVYKFSALNENDNSIWEQRHPAEALIQLRQDNPSVFARNYMNSPIDSSYSLIQREDLRYYEHLDLDKIKEIYIHADTTHTAKTTSDYFCLMAMGEHIDNKNLYVIDFILDKLDPEQQAKQLILMYSRFGNKVKKITFDEKANQGFGYWSKELAKKEYNISLPLEELKYNSDKLNHFEPHIPHFKANRIYLPEKHKDLNNAIQQLLAFPSKGINDDFVDGLSGALDNFNKKSNNISVWAVNY